MEREIVLEIKEDVTPEKLDYLARFVKQCFKAIEDIKAVYVVEREEQMEFAITDEVLEAAFEDGEDE